MNKLKVYVGNTQSEEGAMVGVTTSNHKKLTEQSLKEALDLVVDYSIKLRKEWDNNNWFPCGFVNLTLDGSNDLVKFMKKQGEKMNTSYSFGALRISKAYSRGYYAYINLPIKDALTCQCMNYKTRVYNELQKQLAFLYVTSSVESRID